MMADPTKHRRATTITSCARHVAARDTTLQLRAPSTTIARSGCQRRTSRTSVSPRSDVVWCRLRSGSQRQVGLQVRQVGVHQRDAVCCRIRDSGEKRSHHRADHCLLHRFAPPAVAAVLPGKKATVSTMRTAPIPAATTSDTSIPSTKAARTDASNGAEPSCWATEEALFDDLRRRRRQPGENQPGLIGKAQHTPQDRRPEWPFGLLEGLHAPGGVRRQVPRASRGSRAAVAWARRP